MMPTVPVGMCVAVPVQYFVKRNESGTNERGVEQQ